MKSNEYYEELAVELAMLDKEDDVISLLEKHELWGGHHWRNYGDNENNFATIGNQQSKPESAFVEKIINSVDAVLMAECISRGIKPNSKDAPSTIQNALEEFFNIYGGKLSNIDATTRSQLAEDKINIVATGSKSNPCYSIIDAGEGQSPSQFKNTFLSIGRSNKLKIPFVQGKFNMGGTGVLQFCGKRNIQLVLSKRNPAVASIEGGSDNSNLWGFTVVRREDPADGRRSSVYTYLAPNDSILSFSAKSLPLLPGEYPKPYARDLSYGTFIKLYEYQMQGLKTNILFDLYNRLSLLMPKIALPIRMSERREGYSGHSFETTLSGLTVRLDEDKSSNLEPGFPDSADITVLGQKLKVSIFLFKKNRSIKYTKNEGIIFIINGQTHGDIPRTLFHRKKVGMGYLADSLLVIVDATHISGRAREDLFLNSRDRLREGELNI